jgi:hypothetical protein
MQTICSPKRRFKLVLHGTKSKKVSLIDTAVKAFQKTAVFQYLVFYICLKSPTMDQVHKPGDSEYYTPSLEPFRFKLITFSTN